MKDQTVDVGHGDVSAAIEAVSRLGALELVELEACRAIVLPAGKSIQSLKPLISEYLDRPDRREGVATATTLGSFVDLVNRHKDVGTAVFVKDDSAPEMLAVIDYHELDGQPRFCRHRVRYRFPVSDEWKAWVSESPKALSQEAFAAFIEDHIQDVLSPSEVGESVQSVAERLGITLATPQKLMELSRGLSIRVGQRVRNAVNLATGEATIAFEESHETEEEGGTVRVPGGLALAIPVFKNGDLFQVPVRLRYRTQGGAISWSFVAHRSDRIVGTALDEAVETVRTQTELPVVYGAPESAS